MHDTPVHAGCTMLSENQWDWVCGQVGPSSLLGKVNFYQVFWKCGHHFILLRLLVGQEPSGESLWTRPTLISQASSAESRGKSDL